jgi:hypothetical protein
LEEGETGWRQEECQNMLVGKPKERDRMEDLSTDGSVIMECNIQNIYQSKQIYLENRF